MLRWWLGNATTRGRGPCVGGATSGAGDVRDYARAGTLLAESEARAQTLDGKAMVGMSDVARDQGDWGCASSAGEASLALFRAAGNALGTAFALHNLGLAAHGRGDFAGAQMLLE